LKKGCWRRRKAAIPGCFFSYRAQFTGSFCGVCVCVCVFVCVYVCVYVRVFMCVFDRSTNMVGSIVGEQ
jgi:hypothetical protein